MPPRPRAGLVDQLLPPTSLSHSVCLQCRRHAPNFSVRSFSSTRVTNARTKGRRQMLAWMEGPGASMKQSSGEGSNYIGASSSDNMTDEETERMVDDTIAWVKELELAGDEASDSDLPSSISSPDLDGGSAYAKPFPSNKLFASQPVLSENFKDTIWRMVKEEKKSVRQVSVETNVEMNRIGAVIRLKGVEQKWMLQKKPLANAYAKALMSLLPQSEPDGPAHESINDLQVHRATKPQIFVPASESRAFTRADAGAVFEKGLRPAEERIPHPQLVLMHRLRAAAGVPGSGVADRAAADARLQHLYDAETRQRADAAQRRAARERDNTVVVDAPRATFRFTNVTVDESTVGKDGRGRHGVGARYGLPAQDRKKGQVKIPIRVD